ncbi:MAG TPA: TlpA disulfide reductase family protein [Candidatus Baltobacteraceae bacterium]|nr:TlpA disulfide reductase family protein [Candidatus Baltobacteraceae bacterium]
MNANRARGALVAASLVLIALFASPTLRSQVRDVTNQLGVTSPPRPLATGQSLGTLQLTKLDGSIEGVRTRPGHRLLINVFATWCVPCREETPFLAAAAARLQREGIDVVGVDQAEPPESVVRFVQSYGIEYPTYIDPNRWSALSLDARVIPTTILIDRDNVVRTIHVGPLDESELLAMTRQRG